MDHSDHYDSMHYPDLNFVGNRAILPKQKFERAFKMIKNGVYFIVIALLVAELDDLHCDVTLWTQNEPKISSAPKITKNGISLKTFLYRTETLYSCCTHHKVS